MQASFICIISQGLFFLPCKKESACSSSYKDSSHSVVLKCWMEQTSYSLGFLHGFLAWVVESIKYWQIIRGELVLHEGATHSVTANWSGGANHRPATLWRVIHTPTVWRKSEELGSLRHHLCPTRWSLSNKQERENLRLRTLTHNALNRIKLEIPSIEFGLKS